MDNKLQKTVNEGIIVGTLKDKKIDFKVSAKGNQFASGFLTINVVDANGVGEIKVRVMQMATKADGTENKLYKGLQTVANEYNVGDTVKVLCSLEQNDFYLASEDKVVESVMPKASFVTRVDATTEHCAKVQFGGIIQSIEDREDGTAMVKMIGASFKGDAIPVAMEIPQALVMPFRSKYFEGCTTVLNFHLVNAMIVVEDNTTAEFGESFGSTVTRRVKKNLVFGGGKIEEIGMNPELVRQALTLREMELEKKLNEGRARGNGASTSAPQMNNGFGAPSVNVGANASNPFGANAPF